MISQERLFPLAPPELVALLLGVSLGAPIGATSMLGAGMLGLCGSVCHDDCLWLGLLAEWHEVRQNPGSLAWNHTDVGIRQASPVCMGVNAPIIEEVTRWFRTSPPSCNA